jgi:hypothetical protein
MSAANQQTVSFGQEHFGSAYLADKRRTRSLVDLADRIARHPGGTLPQKFKDPLALRRCYDLLNARAVTHERVLQPHVQRTIALVQQQTGVVLILHDGSELNYSHLASLHDQLGQVGNGSGKGYQCLNSLAVLPRQRCVLGVVNQILFKRPRVPKGETDAQKRDRETRESLLWLQAVDAVQQAHNACRNCLDLDEAAGPLVVDVVDRGGDTFEFLDHEDALGRHYLIRSQHNREIHVGHDVAAEKTRLHDHLRTLGEQGRRTIEITDRPGRPARQATVAIAWAAVTVYPPEKDRGKHRGTSLRAWGLRVWEPEAPPDVEAVEWLLLTTVAVETTEQAWQRIDWYMARWIIEEFHKAQKTGCEIESSQLTQVERLEPLIALLSVVATFLLDLRSASRDEQTKDRPATEKVAEEYVRVLSGWRYKQGRALTVGEFFEALARLGGHQNRRRDHPPGWLVLWRGWQSLQLMLEGARAARLAPSLPPPDGTAQGGQKSVSESS